MEEFFWLTNYSPSLKEDRAEDKEEVTELMEKQQRNAT